ncbi:MAG: VWA domain-containing protein, partial [Actinomycetota bacterium]
MDVANFPEMEILMSMDSAEALSADDVTVLENGGAVSEVEVHPLDEEVTTVDVVLVMDTSGSMEGAPMASAIDAARTFVGELPPDIRVGLVTFSDEPRVLQKISPDRTRLLDEIGSL